MSFFEGVYGQKGLLKAFLELKTVCYSHLGAKEAQERIVKAVVNDNNYCRP